MSQKPKIGDIFQVPIDALSFGYFQYITNDSTQLNSQVVRVFRGRYSQDESTDIARVSSEEAEFHAHVFLTVGIKQLLWRKIGHKGVAAKPDVLFRDTNDFGNPKVKVSRDWHVWKVNEPSRSVGTLELRYQHAEIGVVVPPDSLVCRMRQGSYDFAYPDF